MDIGRLEQMSENVRKRIISLADYCAGDAHWGGALSCVDMLVSLYGAYLNTVDKNLPYGERDKFILSKGQSAVALYSMLAECGLIDEDYLKEFQQNGSILAELAIMDKKHDIECSGGSLGLGLPMGVGLALAAKKRGYIYRTVVMAGDGECNEGSVWEAVMLAGQLKLNNLIFIVDKNNYQSDGNTKDIIDNSNMRGQLEQFGWDSCEINGHDIQDCLKALGINSDKPRAIVMNTVKGKGVSFMENNNTWHHYVLEKKWLEEARKEVGL